MSYLYLTREDYSKFVTNIITEVNCTNGKILIDTSLFSCKISVSLLLTICKSTHFLTLVWILNILSSDILLFNNVSKATNELLFLYILFDFICVLLYVSSSHTLPLS